MQLIFEISDEAIASTPMPRDEIEGHLRAELAAALYAHRVVSMGKAAEMAQISRGEFEDLLGRRHIERNYSLEDLEQDLAWARTQDFGGRTPLAD